MCSIIIPVTDTFTYFSLKLHQNNGFYWIPNQQEVGAMKNESPFFFVFPGQEFWH